jgi:hypothetical protein
MGRAITASKRLIRAVRFAATDRDIPRPLRWLFALGLFPVPGLFDEAVLLLAVIPLGLFYRASLAPRRGGVPADQTRPERAAA